MLVKIKTESVRRAADLLKEKEPNPESPTSPLDKAIELSALQSGEAILRVPSKLRDRVAELLGEDVSQVEVVEPQQVVDRSEKIAKELQVQEREAAERLRMEREKAEQEAEAKRLEAEADAAMDGSEDAESIVVPEQLADQAQSLVADPVDPVSTQAEAKQQQIAEELAAQEQASAERLAAEQAAQQQPDPPNGTIVFPR